MIQKFEFKGLDMKGAYEITPFYATDERGGFIKDYNIDAFKQNGIDHELKEVFYTISKKGVIRAMHFQLVKQQAKLVRCISGHVYDVIIDLRPDSPTFGKWQGFDLTGENQKALYIPQYFGHGYLVLEDSVVSYKCGEVFYGEGDAGIMYNDPDMAIGEFYQFNLSSCIRQQNSLTAQFVSFSLSNLANIFYPPQFLQ